MRDQHVVEGRGGMQDGHSATVFGDAVKCAGRKKFISLERDHLFAAVAHSLVDLSGLGDLVKVVVSRSNDILGPLRLSSEIESLDMLFMNHWKLLYRQDLQLWEIYCFRIIYTVALRGKEEL